MEWPLILNVSLVSLIILLVYPLFILTITKLIKQRRQRYFIKRRPSLVFAQVICIAVSNCILQPILLFGNISIHFTYFQNQNNAFLSSLATSAISLFDICFVLLVGFIMLIRIYLVNYDYEIQKEALNYEWKNVLFAYNDHDINFYTSHKSTYGSLNWIMKRFIPLFLILCLLLFVLQFVFEISVFYIQLVFSLTFLIEIICIILVWLKFEGMPNDKLYIGKELKECISYCLFCVFTGIILITCAQIFDHNINSIEIFMPWIQVLLFNGLTYLSVIRVIQRCTTATNNNTTDYKSKNKYSMKHVISTEYGFEAFINFLVSEFSSESLLLITEYMQIKQSLNLTPKFEESVNCKLHYKIPFNDSKYASPLALDMDTNNTSANTINCTHFMNVIDKFYEKYIYSSAPYCINISYALRLSLSLLLDERYTKPNFVKKRTFSRSRSITFSGLLSRRKCSNEETNGDETEKMTNMPTINEANNTLNSHKQILKDRTNLNECLEIILPLLEQCCIEIIPLLLDSFSRFAKTDEYYIICKTIYTQQQKRKRLSLNKQLVNSKSNNNTSTTRNSFSLSALLKSASSLSKLSIPKLGILSSQSSLSDNIHTQQCLQQEDETKEEEQLQEKEEEEQNDNNDK